MSYSVEPSHLCFKIVRESNDKRSTCIATVWHRIKEEQHHLLTRDEAELMAIRIVVLMNEKT